MKYLLLIPLLCIVITCRTADPAPTLVQLESLTLGPVTVLGVARPTPNNWQITVPYGTNIRQLVPVLTVTPGATIVPRSGEVQDFSQPVLFTLTAADGTKAVYQITVIRQAQPRPVITGLSPDTVQAGNAVVIRGRNFGTFPPAVQVFATGSDNLPVSVAYTLTDSNRAEARLPATLTPGRYRMQVSVNGLGSTEVLSVWVRYPSPGLVSISPQHLRAGDTLRITGVFIQPASYQYALLLRAGGPALTVPVVASGSGRLSGLTAGSTVPGIYQVTILNRSENTRSRDTTLRVQVYERGKPFVTGIVSPAASYQAGQPVLLRTVDFAALPTRFYQCQLTGPAVSYTSNGVYDAIRQQLTLTLPASMAPGIYTLGMRFLGDSGNLLYEIDTDNTLLIR